MIRRLASTLTATTLTVTALAPTALTPTAQALPTPVSPTDPLVAEQWVNSAVRPLDHDDDQVDFSLTRISGLKDGVAPPDTPITATVEITNKQTRALPGVEVGVQRANAVGPPAEVRTALAADRTSYPVFGPVEEVGTIEPGETLSVDFDLTGTLGLQAGETYPVLFSLFGDAAELSSERTVIAVGDAPEPEPEPEPEPDTDTDTEPDTTTEPPKPAGVTAVVPITQPVDIAPGETGNAPERPELVLRSEDLAAALADDGRLGELLTTVEKQLHPTDGTDTPLARSVCLALDPALIDTVDRMATDGYVVADSRPDPSTEALRLRERWTAKPEADKGVPGTGGDVAKEWINRLRAVAKDSCVVALPWANADINAVAGAKSQPLMEEAVGRGTETLDAILGDAAPAALSRRPAQAVLIPPSGYVTEQTLAGLKAMSSPDIPTRALVAGAAGSTRLDDRVIGVGMDPDVSSLIAQSGPEPQTLGYTDPATRFDYAVDSPTARLATAQSSLRLALRPGADDLVTVLPSDVDATTAGTLLTTLDAAMADHDAAPVPLSHAMAGGLDPLPTAPQLGSPFDDPTAISDAEILRAEQQARYTTSLRNLVTPGHAISLSPAQYVRPLYRDVLSALRVGERQSLHSHDDAVARTDAQLKDSSDSLSNLLSSVSLLPPGNVYTRASESSPLLVVAENSLPLPVEATIGYTGPEGATLTTPQRVRIPARGSLTLEMTADLPVDEDQTTMSVWLASPDGGPISTPVDIAVRTRAGLLGTRGMILLGVAALTVLLAWRTSRWRTTRSAKRHRLGNNPHNHRPPNNEGRTPHRER